MQWAYSELFQNYSGPEIASYLDHCFRQTKKSGLLVHYSETHDNDRLAARGRTWALLRNRLCALTSVGGGFGFTCGVEWLAADKIRVHDRTSMNWGAAENIVPELAALNHLLADHPCFFDGARLVRVSPADSPIYALLRESEEGNDQALILINTSADQPAALALSVDDLGRVGCEWIRRQPRRQRTVADTAFTRIPRGILKFAQPVPNLTRWCELLGQRPPEAEGQSDGSVAFILPPGAAYCLSPAAAPRGLHGEQYRQTRAQAAWGLKAISQLRSAESIPLLDWRELAGAVNQLPARFLAAVSNLRQNAFPANFLSELNQPKADPNFPQVVLWSLLDAQRVTLVPPGHWLLLQDTVRFRAKLRSPSARTPQVVESIPAATGHIACFAPLRSTRQTQR